MNKVYNLETKFDKGQYRGKKVKDIVSDKKVIMNLIKEGISFSDEVLTEARIKKNVRDVKVTQTFVEHEVDNKVYEKETMSIKNILKSLHTIDNSFNYDSLDENEDFDESDSEDTSMYD